jgi:hypothetical protein
MPRLERKEKHNAHWEEMEHARHSAMEQARLGTRDPRRRRRARTHRIRKRDGFGCLEVRIIRIRIRIKC